MFLPFYKALQNADLSIVGNKSYMLDLVKIDGNILQFASDKLKNDSTVGLEAIKQNDFALRYIGNDLKTNRKFVKSVILRNGNNLCHFPHFAGDRKMVVVAIEANPWALKYASDDLKADKELIFKVIKRSANYIEEVDPKLITDRDFVLDAVKCNGLILQYCKEFHNDDEIVIAAIKNCGSVIKSLPNYAENPKYALMAISSNSRAICSMSKKLTADFDFMIKAVSMDSRCIRFASTELKDNETLAIAAIKKIPFVFSEVSQRLKDDKDMMELALSLDQKNIRYVTRFDLIDVSKYITDPFLYYYVPNMKCLDGATFNKLFAGKKLIKFIRNDMKSYDFTFKEGLNIDINPFKPQDETVGGLYFTTEEYEKDVKHFGPLKFTVEIPDDAQVYIENNRLKADKIILHKK